MPERVTPPRTEAPSSLKESSLPIQKAGCSTVELQPGRQTHRPVAPRGRRGGVCSSYTSQAEARRQVDNAPGTATSRGGAPPSPPGRSAGLHNTTHVKQPDEAIRGRQDAAWRTQGRRQYVSNFEEKRWRAGLETDGGAGLPHAPGHIASFSANQPSWIGSASLDAILALWYATRLQLTAARTLCKRYDTCECGGRPAVRIRGFPRNFISFANLSLLEKALPTGYLQRV